MDHSTFITFPSIVRSYQCGIVHFVVLGVVSRRRPCNVGDQLVETHSATRVVYVGARRFDTAILFETKGDGRKKHEGKTYASAIKHKSL